MDRDEITLTIDLLHRVDVLHISGKVPRGVYRDEGIVSVHFHSHMGGSVGHLHADGSQTDHAQLLSGDLCSGVCLLLLLGHLGDVRLAAVLLDPLDAAHDISRCEQHSREHQLLDAVGVGAGCVEHDDTLLGAFVQRDIVDACTGPRHSCQTLRQLQIMHGRAAHQHSVRLSEIIHLFVIGGKHIQPLAGNRI